MSDSKKEKTGVTKSREITISDFSEDVPGVTQLLNPGLARQRKSSEPAAKPTRTQAEEKSGIVNRESPADSTGGLGSLGVEFHLTFLEEGGTLRFQGIKETGNEPFPAWKHSFFQNMKIDLRILGINVSFQEFSADQSVLQREAFGLDSGEFVQLVRDPNDRKKMHVLFSKRSLLGKKTALEQALFGKPSESDGDADGIKIELDT